MPIQHRQRYVHSSANLWDGSSWDGLEDVNENGIGTATIRRSDVQESVPLQSYLEAKAPEEQDEEYTGVLAYKLDFNRELMILLEQIIDMVNHWKDYRSWKGLSLFRDTEGPEPSLRKETAVSVKKHNFLPLTDSKDVEDEVELDYRERKTLCHVESPFKIGLKAPITTFPTYSRLYHQYDLTPEPQIGAD